MEKERVALFNMAWKNPPAIADLGWKSCGADALEQISVVSGPVEICQE